MKKIWKPISIIVIILAVSLPASHINAASAQYDNSGRLISIEYNYYKISYLYDKNGNLIKRTVTPNKK